MGFVIEELIGVLDFSDTELDGATVKMSLDISRGEARALPRLIKIAEEDDDTDPIADVMLQNLRGWDLERNGELIPETREGLDSLPVRMVTYIAEAWFAAVTDPPLGINAPSTHGKPPESETNPVGPPTSLNSTSGANAGDSPPTLSIVNPPASSTGSTG